MNVLSRHSGLLHTDGLVSTFAILALTAALNGLREPRRAVWWPLTGFFVGLALLSKTPALILLPYVLFVQFVASFRAARASSLKPDILRLLIHSSSFALAVALTCLALYPALWANPIDTFHYLTSSANRHIETVQHPIFFAGRMVSDPGAAFYAAAFLFRLSPVVLIALVGGLFSGIVDRRPNRGTSRAGAAPACVTDTAHDRVAAGRGRSRCR